MMLEGIQLQRGDRVLFLTIPDKALAASFSAQVGHGILVGIGTREEIAEARRVMIEIENMMFVPATPDEIPWQDGFFNCILDPRGGWEVTPLTEREIARVLAPGGMVKLS
ncbi:MAG: hypothetical protein JJE04_20325 [Acidobacteriia bacterium]|nr:hypothetical protein [Terriglobia bacterium]